MQTPPTQMSPAGTFTRTAVHCKKYISFLQHSHFVRMNHPNNLTDMPESIYSTSNIKSNIRECDREILEKVLAWNKTQPNTHQNDRRGYFLQVF